MSKVTKYKLGREMLEEVYKSLPLNPTENSPAFKKDLYGYLDKENNLGLRFMGQSELKNGKYIYTEYLGYIVWSLDERYFGGNNKVSLVNLLYRRKGNKITKISFEEMNSMLGDILDKTSKEFYSLVKYQLLVRPFKVARIIGGDYSITLEVAIPNKRTYLEKEFGRYGVKSVDGRYYDEVMGYCFGILGIHDLVEFDSESSLFCIYVSKNNLPKVCEGINKIVKMLNTDKGIREVVKNVGV